MPRDFRLNSAFHEDVLHAIDTGLDGGGRFRKAALEVGPIHGNFGGVAGPAVQVERTDLTFG